jgi:hypothetical protein
VYLVISVVGRNDVAQAVKQPLITGGAAVKQDQASVVALEALAYIAAEEAALLRFIQFAGVSPDQLRRAAGEPETQAGVLDFVLSDESLLLAFCDACGHSPETPAKARQALPGAATEDY